MPYIKQEDRIPYEQSLSELAALVKEEKDFNEKLVNISYLIDSLSNKVRQVVSSNSKSRPGHLNYMITTLFHKVYGKEMRYYDHNEVIGILKAVETAREFAAGGNSKASQLSFIIQKLIFTTYGSIDSDVDTVEVLGMLTCCSQEFYRRSTAIYENKCIDLHGDVVPESLD